MYYMQDANYNVIALVEGDIEDYAVLERYNYAPYGDITITDADYLTLSESAAGNGLTFQGRRLDAETGLYYFGNRHYHSELGRFGQRDTFGYIDGMNLYEFVRGNPLVLTDPTGGCADQHRRIVAESYSPNVTVVGRNKHECGEARFRVEFSVPPGKKPGHLVQRIDKTMEIIDCATNRKVASGSTFYYETPMREEHGWPTPDTFQTVALDNTCGYIRLQGNAKVLHNWRPGPEFAKGAAPLNPEAYATTPGLELPGADTIPDHPGGDNRYGKHWMEIRWDCCPGSTDRSTRLSTWP